MTWQHNGKRALPNLEFYFCFCRSCPGCFRLSPGSSASAVPHTKIPKAVKTVSPVIPTRFLVIFQPSFPYAHIVIQSTALHMTQPTLSRQLMDLEEEIGKKLLIRSNRRITLTEEGMLLRKRAAEIIDLLEKTEAELTAPDEVVSGDIYIGGGETDAMRLIARIAADLLKTCPHIRYHIFSGNADDVTERLDKGLLDFGILIEPADMKKYDYIRIPATDT